jgi:nicotinamidase-related amidase
MSTEHLSRPALVVVDMQNGFLNHHSKHITPAVVALAQEWSSRGLPVVFTRFLNRPDSAYEKYFSWTRLTDSPETDLAAELADLTDGRPVIDKPGYTLFTPEGASLVAEHEWTDLVFCGVATDSCVLKSAADAFEHGYGPWIVTDACASDAGPDVHDAGLTVAHRLIGRRQLVTTEELLARLASAESRA